MNKENQIPEKLADQLDMEFLQSRNNKNEDSCNFYRAYNDSFNCGQSTKGFIVEIKEFKSTWFWFDNFNDALKLYLS